MRDCSFCRNRPGRVRSVRAAPIVPQAQPVGKPSGAGAASGGRFANSILKPSATLAKATSVAYLV